jgi:hypothetical protein
MNQGKPNLWTTSTIILVLGDIVALILFTLIGQRQHDIAISAMGIIVTTAPFIIAWLVVGFFMGAFKPSAYFNIGQAAKKVTIVWLIAGPVGLGLRALFEQKGVPLNFVIITMVVILIFLLVWRILFVLLKKIIR